ncbi:MAG: DNA-directed RNA polymerase subunit F [Thermoprotei archaeon]|nr:MAG: DNA-directed RNA polymerase subunit F [Thermoprotei archaeon]
MAKELDLEVIEERALSNAEAYKILRKIVDKIAEKEGAAPLLLVKTLEYLKKTTKIDPDSAEALRELLSKYKLREESIIMIMNICPTTVDELRTLLELEERVIETETAREIVETIRQYCKE